ncbi:paraoxonase, putative [Talaromyces stipitatus ATCC 10500]|uniref:Paraoxonase, putative n=1 Tax=Talaromyces stipitatus (strain ATCC 10500 / CBS 375.48 / QM 6759 / NRRL 1006) TaxID=441959 RepID=B8MDK2_TALSN|nr:paraoxonase, putative [Talaromyces stipitatus ATCC 10500]EED17965.1 paraoxonase, putative [Talaromyces stipitatus ATCC 10500]
MGLSPAQAIAIIVVLSFLLLFLHKILSPWVELPRLPEQWLAFRSGLAWTIFKDRVGFSEDMVLDHESGFAIISSDPGRVCWNALWGRSHNPHQQGRLLLYHYGGSGSLREMELVNFPDNFDFHPLGMGLYREMEDSHPRLFVVNQGDDNSSVEIMDIDYEDARAVHVCTVEDNNHTIRSPVSVSPVSYSSFYVTNDQCLIRRRHPVLSFTERVLGLPLGWVTFVDFSIQARPICTIVAGGIPFASGILVTPTGKEVLVASNSTDTVRIYERNPDTNTLSSNYSSVYMTFHPETLSFDKSLDIDDPTVFNSNGYFLRGVVATGSPDAGRLFCMATNPHGCAAPSVVAEIRRGHGPDLSPFPGSLFNLLSKYYARTLYAGMSMSLSLLNLS